MFAQRIRLHPAAGKAADLRAVLEEASRALHAQGKVSTVSQVVFGDDSGAFTVLNVHDDLAAFQTFRASLQADPAAQARFQRMAGLVRQPSHAHLFEAVPVPGAADGPVAKFGMTTTFVPVPGELPRLRAALEEYVAVRNRAGIRMGILTSVSGTGRILGISSHASMAELESARSAAAATPEWAALSLSLGGLLREPANTEVFEILLANPA